MNKTKIPWCDYTINPVKGLCPMACSYCYARRMYKRFKWNPIIRYDDWVWQEGCHIPKDSKIFVGSTMELFGEWVKPEWLEYIFAYCRSCPSHTFIFLTKQPQNLIKWSLFPDNCWVGVTATDQRMWNEAICALSPITASVKFISLEPWLGYVVARGAYDVSELNWLIIGCQTQPKRYTPLKWVNDILKTPVPIFVKEPMASHYNIQRQEFPNAQR